MATSDKKKAILKKAVKNCGKGGPGWDNVKKVAGGVAKFALDPADSMLGGWDVARGVVSPFWEATSMAGKMANKLTKKNNGQYGASGHKLKIPLTSGGADTKANWQ